MKTCTHCKTEKPPEAFHQRLDTKDGRAARCRDCDRKKVAEYRERNRDAIRTRQRAAYRADPTKHQQRGLRRKYGLSLIEVQTMIVAQSGRCAICAEVAALNVDHCHVTGRVRALLCAQCNTALGLAHESPERPRALAVYLEKHNSKEHDR